MKAYDELLDDSQTIASHYVSLNKNFQKLFLELENLKNEKEKLGHEKTKLLKEYTFFQNDVNPLKTEASKASKNISFDISELQRTINLLKLDVEKMVNGSKKNLTWCLVAKGHILIKLDLGSRKKLMKNDPKIVKIKFLFVYTVSRRDTLLKNAFLLKNKKIKGEKVQEDN